VIRILSLWQPWATFMVVRDPQTGHPPKRIETRHWKPRGKIQVPCDVAIHATQRIEKKILHLPAVAALGARLGSIVFPRGAVLAIATLRGVYPAEEIRRTGLSALEQVLGDYSDGRFGFLFDAVQPLRTPLELKGRQSVLWVAPADLEAEIRQAAARC
jgi:hypothetical protein